MHHHHHHHPIADDPQQQKKQIIICLVINLAFVIIEAGAGYPVADRLILNLINYEG